MRALRFLLAGAVLLVLQGLPALAQDDGQVVPRAQYADRDVDLHDQVLKLVRQGQHWDQLYRNVKFKDEYTQWFGYEHMRVLNILGMCRWVTKHRRGVW
jgi:hypothetical protein